MRFSKEYGALHCLTVLIEKCHKFLDKGGFNGFLKRDLSKAFDCTDHGLLIAKMDVYGFDVKSLKFSDSYLGRRKERVKINSSFSEWSEVQYRVWQGSILHHRWASMVRRGDGVCTSISFNFHAWYRGYRVEIRFSNNPRQKEAIDNIIWLTRKKRVIYRLGIIFSITHVIQLMVPKINLFCQRDIGRYL